MRRKTDLWILGIGIRGMQQITLETLEVLERCRRVLHLTHQHREMKRLNPNVVDLEPFYWTAAERDSVYEDLVELVLDEVENGPEVALVSYGHPMIYDDVTLDLVRLCRRRGFRCRVLPAVSCLDSLAIDLGIDYGYGLQVYEATQLVEEEYVMNPALHTLIMQLGVFGTSRITDRVPNRPGRFTPLVEFLERFYPSDHPATIAFSDDGSMSGPKVVKTRISRLDSHRRSIFPGVTLYLPPLS